MPKKTIRIAVKGAATVPFTEFREFQGDLKSITIDNFNALRRSIETEGFCLVVHLWKDPKGQKHIVDGHQRRRVLMKLAEDGYDIPPIPVAWVDAKSIQEAKRKVLAAVSQHGKIEGQGLYQFSIESGIPPTEILEKWPLPDFDIPEWNQEFFIDPQTAPTDADDDVPETPLVAKSKLGDLWILGEHRLLCGDSTKLGNVQRLLDGANADITFTSPPYNAAKDSDVDLHKLDKAFSRKYENNTDAMSDEQFVDFLSSSVDIAIAHSSYVFWNMQLLRYNRQALLEWLAKYRTQIKDILIWNKNRAPPNITIGAFNTKFEFVFVLSTDTKTRAFPVEWRGQYPNVVEVPNNSENENADSHRAGFPVAFPTWFLEKLPFAKQVYEPFSGTGTTMIACQKLGRKCYGMELDPLYVDVAVARWEKFTGQIAVLADDPKPKTRRRDDSSKRRQSVSV